MTIYSLITEQSKLEGTRGGHPVRPCAQGELIPKSGCKECAAFLKISLSALQ